MIDETASRRVLIIDDNEAIHEDFRKILSEQQGSEELNMAEAAIFGDQPVTTHHQDVTFDLESAHQGLDGVRKCKEALEAGMPYSLAFVDMRMPPGIDGLETVEKLWQVDPSLQVVICTAYSDYSWDEIVDRLGRSDRWLLLKKPFDNAEVSQMAHALTAKWFLGRQARMQMSELDELVQKRTIELESEIEERKAAQDSLRHQALHDSLTGLPNRAMLMDRLERCLERVKREPDNLFAVLFLDIDNFKLINDSLGHEIGDQLLMGISDRIRIGLRAIDTTVQVSEDTTARLGGDEFVVLLEGLKRPSDSALVAERIQQELEAPFDLSGHDIVVSASIGIAVGTEKYDTSDQLLRDADTAMYRAKSTGKARHAIFDDALHSEAIQRLQIENDLRRAVQQEQFAVVYEPIVDLDSGQIVGFETLVRWNHPERGFLTPGAFIDVAEETGLIVPIGYWVLKTACRQLSTWIDTLPGAKDLTISVNMSRRQLTEPGVVHEVQSALQDAGLDGAKLNLEITESSIMRKPESMVAVLKRLKELGLRLHMDDFGTGLSSLSCLHTFPIDVLKIDRSFVLNMGTNREFAAVVYAVLTLAQHLNLRVIAEGVETKDQLAQLLALGCDCVQGYHLSRSLNADEATVLIQQGSPFQRDREAA